MKVLRRIPLLSARRTIYMFRRANGTYQSPTPSPNSGSNAHRDFYKVWGRPLAKNFLIAMCTYQVLYWSWLKLESLETKQETEEEIKSLEGELRHLTGARPSSP